MLRLASSTDPSWVNRALNDLDVILIDHAHCEKKAASSALNFIFRYPEHLELMTPLSALAREELRHFEQVLTILMKRNVPFRRLEPSLYASRLVSIVRKSEPERMLDMMICASIIEARSCERMSILAEALLEIEPSLAQFYRGLLACEARHHQTYLTILKPFFEPSTVSMRVHEIAKHEAMVLTEHDPNVRLHSP
ncbi:MAG: tRNA-(ms[2]io[6]A)-hydroxylase [Myxococcota bacterium]|nr:tRNA-(ms[2]io[6]A)-hydroxylase [Myxococcota bacterium]